MGTGLLGVNGILRLRGLTGGLLSAYKPPTHPLHCSYQYFTEELRLTEGKGVSSAPGAMGLWLVDP